MHCGVAISIRWTEWGQSVVKENPLNLTKTDDDPLNRRLCVAFGLHSMGFVVNCAVQTGWSEGAETYSEALFRKCDVAEQY